MRPTPTTKKGSPPGRLVRVPDVASTREPRGPRTRGPNRRTVPAGKALVVMLVCLLAWLSLDATALRRAAEVSPIGARRTAALLFLRPLASISAFAQLDHLRNGIARAAGQDTSAGPGSVSIEPVPVTSPDAGGQQQETPANADAPLPPPTRDHPLRIAVVGDSFASGVGSAMERALNPRSVDVQARGVISTGLTRPDYFNWRSGLQDILDRYRPGVVVVMLGGNDAQTMTVPGGGAPIPLEQQDKWRQTYAQRVQQLVGITSQAGARLVWVGLPPMRDINRDHQAHRLDEIYRQVASTTPGAAYVNSLQIFAKPGAGYAAYLPDDSGKQQLVRESDGEHFTSLGYDWVAAGVIATLEKRWDFPADAAR